MSREKLGSLIGAAFGLVFVLVNTSSVATALAVLLRALGVVALLAVLIAVRRSGPVTSALFRRRRLQLPVLACRGS